MTTSLDRANAEFWDELCGSTFARALGITDHAPASLARFDQAYLAFYPYLLKHVPVHRMAGKRVLEVGLGYGTLGQQIALSGADYTGLDVALGPVRMMRHRLRMQGRSGQVVRGSILDAPLASDCFDHVVSVGCFHHTGDVQRCIDETYRLLRPGGTAMVMVYNRFSYRQWLRWPKQTLQAALQERRSPHGMLAVARTGQHERAAYDVNTSGEAAPETVFLSVKQLVGMFRNYSHVEFHRENCDNLPFGGERWVARNFLLATIGRVAGLDLYLEARK